MWSGWRIVTAAAEHTALLGIGTNLGDRTANLRAAITGLAELGSVVCVSRVYESEPYGYVDQPWFLNMAVTLRTGLAPEDLLGALKALEARMGREPGRRMGPRLIDIDILFYDDLQLDTASLRIPHHGVMDRAFVLAPLLDLDIGLRHPATGELLAERVMALDDSALVPLGSAAEVLNLDIRASRNR
ncbi:MAG: 2-amino-4-hydroxy-6-hydroxymethyldihydropteridine diphosphokinase [Gemmatimonadetes bacterium]|nr:2-amino-4-hydroxy-6-hydroxymethyldihydropteridine diphosphokinase [Gemmatimonadota bacterium]